MSTEPIKSFKQRAEAAKEDRERYTADPAQRHCCPVCGQEHWVKKETKSEREK